MHHQAPTPIEHERVRDFKTRVIVAGSRSFNDYPFFCKIMDGLLEGYTKPVVFISGKADYGADEMVIRWCIERSLLWAEYPADWRNIDTAEAIVKYDRGGRPYNARAGIDRNMAMGDVGSHLVAFWDMKSTGTRHMREYALSRKLKVQTVLVDPDPQKELS